MLPVPVVGLHAANDDDDQDGQQNADDDQEPEEPVGVEAASRVKRIHGVVGGQLFSVGSRFDRLQLS